MKRNIVLILYALAGLIAGIYIVGNVTWYSIEKARKMSDKHLALFLMMVQWVKIKQEGKCLASYFEKNNYRKIAIYGMSHVGQALVNELKGTDIITAYGIDKNADSCYVDLDIFTINDVLKPVDAVVVTAVTFFDEIEKQIAQKLSCPIISLEAILYEA